MRQPSAAPDPGLIRKSLDVSWKEGIPAAVMLGIADYYMIPYGLFLGATAHEIGLLVAIPHLSASFAQLWAVRMVRHAGSRLNFLIRSTFFQALLFIPMALLALKPHPARLGWLIFLSAAYRISGNLIGTAWGSLMSDYLPANQRGNYFGWRARTVGIAGLAGIAFSGFFLYLMRNINPAVGFFLLFLFAGFCRFLSHYLMRRMLDLPLEYKIESDFTFMMFIRRFKESNFVKFVLYVAGITFATNISAPFFSVYMLRDLNFNYLNYTMVQFASVAAGLISFPLWGKHADVVGNASILKTTSFLVPVIPLLWVFSKNPAYLSGLEFFSGFVWGGFNLCASNFIYDAVSPEKRVRCLGYFNLINGIALFSGTFLGGWMSERVPALLGSRLCALFLVSGLLRMAAHFLLSDNFKEVRQTERKISSRKLFFSVVGIRPILGGDTEWYVFPLLKKFRIEALFERSRKSKEKNE